MEASRDVGYEGAMKAAIITLGAALALSGAAPRNAVTELTGRTPGKTQRCIPFKPGSLFTVSRSDPHVLLYEDGETFWASRLAAGCGFQAGQTAVPDSNAAYYCSGDLVRTGGRVTLMPFGELCALGKFTAYKNK